MYLSVFKSLFIYCVLFIKIASASHSQWKPSISSFRESDKEPQSDLRPDTATDNNQTSVPPPTDDFYFNLGDNLSSDGSPSIWATNEQATDQDPLLFNSIPRPFDNFKVVAICEKTLAILGYSSNGEVLERCELFDLEKHSEKAFKAVQKIGLPIHKVDFRTMKEIVNRCREISQLGTDRMALSATSEESYKNSTTDSEADSWGIWRGLVPGTKWCGLGDAADNYFDLGSRREIDLCCRAHDHCPVRLKAFRYGYGLINLSLYTKSHCECDEDFHRCLKQTNSVFSQKLGNFYFNVMRIQCIKEENVALCLEKTKIQGKEQCTRFASNAMKEMKFSQPSVSF